MNNINSDQRWDLIERYLSHQLEKEELASFESALENDSSLHEDLTTYQLTIQGIKEHAFKAQLSVKRAHYEAYEKRTIGYHSLSYTIGIAAVLILSFCFYFWNTQTKAVVFENYYEPYPDIFSTRENNIDLFHRGMKAYSLQRYEEASLLLIENKDPASLNASFFYLAQVKLITGKPELALDYLLTVRQRGNEFFQESTWYIALAYLKMKDNTNCLHYLDKINSGDFNYEKALLLKKGLL